MLFVITYFSESMNIFLVALTCLGVCQFALVNLNTQVMIEGGKFKNEKNSKINEALQNLSCIQQNGWEPHFIRSIHSSRSKELSLLLRRILYYLFKILLSESFFPLIAVITLAVSVIKKQDE